MYGSRQIVVALEICASRGGVLVVACAGAPAAYEATVGPTVPRMFPAAVIVPPPVLCTDNGAMIAACAYYQYQRDEQYGLDLDIDPALPLG